MRARWCGILCVFLISAVAVLCGGCGEASVTVSRFSVSAVQAGDGVVKAVQNAFASGRAFKAQFLNVDPAGAVDTRKQASVQAGLNAFRAEFGANPVFRFVDGVHFELGEHKGPILCPMKGETVDHPSMFSLRHQPKRQTYVVFAGTDRNGATLHVHLLMWQVSGQWKAADMTYYPAAVGGLDFEKAFAAAEAERRAGRNVIALGLYALATELSEGPAYRTSGQQHRVTAAVEPLNRQLGLPGRAAETLQTSLGRVEVRDVGGAVTTGGSFLSFSRHIGGQLGSPATLTNEHRILAGAFLKKHLTLPSYFAGLMVATVSPGGRGHRSVFPWNALAASRPATGPADRGQSASPSRRRRG